MWRVSIVTLMRWEYTIIFCVDVVATKDDDNDDNDSDDEDTDDNCNQNDCPQWK
jgi:hypothetical protein